jgi:hypothetical protein
MGFATTDASGASVIQNIAACCRDWERLMFRRIKEDARAAVFVGVPMLICAVLSTQARAHGVGHAAAPKAVLAPGDSTFWDGGDVPTSSVPSCSAGSCLSYVIDLAPGGRRLRVGIDTPRRSDTFAIELIDPGGATAATTSNSNQFNSEALVLDPAAGKWTVRVRPEAVTATSVRLRAKLEAVLPEDLTAQMGRVPLLPNLRTVPPYEFTFIAPLNPLNGLYPPDTINPPLAIGDIHPISCTVDEMAPAILGGAGAVRCLRFTSGPMNLGPGIYDMRFSLIDDLITGTAQLNPLEALSRIVVGPMLQVIHFADGSTEEVPAGTYSFHPIHGHFHDDYVLSFELFKVDDAKAGAMTRVGEGTKSGFCPADQLFADWSVFEQGYEVPGGDTSFGSCFSPNDGVIGLSIGWGDVYRWQRPGMYVEFAGMSDGRYVVNSRVDADDHVLETDSSDNVSYAYIDVKGDTIMLLERGWGTSPWDGNKKVFDGEGPAQRDMTASSAGASDGSGSSSSGGMIPELSILMLLAAAALRRSRWHRTCQQFA